MMNRPEYVAVVIHYRDSESLNATLQGLVAQTTPPKRVIVVDNSSVEDPAKIWIESEQHVTLISAPSNLGYAGAVNLARQVVLDEGVPLLLVVTQDVVWGSGTVREMIGVTELGYGVVGPTLMKRSKPEDVFSTGGRFGFGGRSTHLAPPQAGDATVRAVDWVDGAVLLISVEQLQQVGWFDEDYFLYYEEVDLAYRVAKNGGRVGLATKAVAFQEPGNYTPYLRLRNQILFWNKNLGGWQLYPSIFYQICRTAAKSIVQRNPAVLAWGLRGMIDGWRKVGGPPPRTIAVKPWSGGMQ